MDPLERGAPFERAARDEPDKPNDVAAAYTTGYTDGITLLRSDGHDQAPVEPLERIYARYFRYIELDPPTPEAHAYIRGFRDAAADNLPCPLHEIESEVGRLVT